MEMPKENEPIASFVFFIDLVDSSAFKTRHKPAVWIPCMQDFFDYLNDFIVRYKGQVIKFIGDEVMGVIPAYSDALNEELQENLEMFFYGLKVAEKDLSGIFSNHTAADEAIKLKTAFDFGTLFPIVGNKAEKMHDYLGTPVDRCARISKFAKQSTILASKEAIDKLNQIYDDGQKPFTTRHISTIALKGINKYGENASEIHQISPSKRNSVKIDTGTIKGYVGEDYPDYALHKDIICDFQGDYAQFSLSVANTHKIMKEALSAKNGQLSDEVIKAHSHIKQELALGLTNAWMRSYEYLENYFEDRKYHLPNINFKTTDSDDGEKITPLFRNKIKTRGDLKSSFTPTSNTGFNKIVHRNARYYCQNNIPKVAKANYENGRLNKDSVKNYRLDTYTFQPDGQVDKEWIECWHDYKEHFTAEVTKDIVDKKLKTKTNICSRYYKSVLIVPLTLKGCYTTRELEKVTTLKKSTIYGYIAVEHHDAEYFIEEKDSKMLFLLADLLSLYRVLDYNYTMNSDTWLNVRNLILKENSGEQA